MPDCFSFTPAQQLFLVYYLCLLSEFPTCTTSINGHEIEINSSCGSSSAVVRSWQGIDGRCCCKNRTALCMAGGEPQLPQLSVDQGSSLCLHPLYWSPMAQEGWTWRLMAKPMWNYNLTLQKYFCCHLVDNVYIAYRRDEINSSKAVIIEGCISCTK